MCQAGCRRGSRLKPCSGLPAELSVIGSTALSVPPALPACVYLQDDEAELLAELDRIKRERAEEAAKAAAEAAAKRSAEEQAELIRGNPLLQEKLAAQGGRLGGSQLVPVCLCAVFGKVSAGTEAARRMRRCCGSQRTCEDAPTSYIPLGLSLPALLPTLLPACLQTPTLR